MGRGICKCFPASICIWRRRIYDTRESKLLFFEYILYLINTFGADGGAGVFGHGNMGLL